MKTAVAVRHVAFEDLGFIAPWLQQRGWRVAYHDAGVDHAAAIDLEQADLFAVLGGPIGAHDDALYPFLSDEVRLIRQRIDSGRPILGICLGAQLMARALGAKVASRSRERARAVRSRASASSRSCTGTATSSSCRRACPRWPAPRPARTRHSWWATMRWHGSSISRWTPRASSSG